LIRTDTFSQMAAKMTDQLKSELMALLENDVPTPEQKEQIKAIVTAIAQSSPLAKMKKDIEEAIMLVESDDSNLTMPIEEKSAAIVALTEAGDRKIALFAAMRRMK
jgi:hypothetical protein